MNLNLLDEGTRQCIICTNNENEIAEEVCYPRVVNLLKGYRSTKGENISGTKNNLKYYKTTFIGKNNIKNIVDEDKIELSHKAGTLLSIAENTLYLKEENSYWQIFEDKNNNTAIYFREELSKFDQFVKKVSELKGKVIVYTFSWGHEEFIDDFNQLPHVMVKSIPQPILEIYRQIYNLS